MSTKVEPFFKSAQNIEFLGIEDGIIELSDLESPRSPSKVAVVLEPQVGNSIKELNDSELPLVITNQQSKIFKLEVGLNPDTISYIRASVNENTPFDNLFFTDNEKGEVTKDRIKDLYIALAAQKILNSRLASSRRQSL